MFAKLIFWLFLFGIFPCLLLSQQALPVDTIVRSIYSEPFFGQELYQYTSETGIEAKIKALCEVDSIPIDFELVASNVTSVAVIKTAKKRYLLYGSFFFWSKEDDLSSQYLVLAHAVAHLANQHSLQPPKRIFEEISADERAGRLLFKIHNIGEGITLESLRAALVNLPFGYPEAPLEKRLEAFNRGWAIADGQMNAEKSAGFFLNETNVESLPLPRFWQDGSPSVYQDNKNVLSRAFTPTKTPTLGRVDELIQKALKNAGFQQWSYHVVNNGFSLVTQIEQFDNTSNNAKSISGEHRWRDTPPEENISTFLNYLKGFLWPRNGYFRFFVFVVTDQPIPKRREEIVVNPKFVNDLMKSGSSSLTRGIAALPFTRNFKVSILVYEFEVPENTRVGQEKAPPLFQPEMHLKGASILSHIR